MEVIALSGIVGHGHQRGRELGFPTANVTLDAGLDPPAFGVYAGWLELVSPGQSYGATVSVGDNPTFGDVHSAQVEAYLHDFAREIYGEPVRITLVARLREMRKFASARELAAQIVRDVAASRRLIAPPER